MQPALASDSFREMMMLPPITLSFTTFPGLSVRLGRWYTDSFPTCGCDACDETSEGERKRLENLVEALTAGRFREARGLSYTGEAWAQTSFWEPWGMIWERPVLRFDRNPTRWTLGGRWRVGLRAEALGVQETASREGPRRRSRRREPLKPYRRSSIGCLPIPRNGVAYRF